MHRVVSIQSRRNLQARAKRNASDVRRCDDTAEIVWLFPTSDAPTATEKSSLTADQGYFTDLCWILLRWTFNATAEGLALYAASYDACGLYPAWRSPLDSQTCAPDRERTFG
jgi:hypothetical protein